MEKEAFYTAVRNDTKTLIAELIEASAAEKGELFVLGGSSSEVLGKQIGKGSSAEIGEIIVSEIHAAVSEAGCFLAVQCCEHLNRALVVERAYAETHGLPEVNALPQLHAGGSFAVAAWKAAEAPCLVEEVRAEAGLDIGDTLIGMHLRPVAVPLRLSIKTIGKAHVTAARCRRKLIGGARAVYQEA